MGGVMFSEEWLRAYCQRTGNNKGLFAGPDGELVAKPKRSKYGNRKATRGEEAFDSEHEAEVYDELVLQQKAGEIRGFTRQQVFLLPGGVKYIADFVVLHNDRSYCVVDAKSVATRKDKVYRIKKRQMRECLGLDIIEV